MMISETNNGLGSKGSRRGDDAGKDNPTKAGRDEKYYAGIDVGSVSIKAVLVRSGSILASSLIPSGGNYKDGVQKIMNVVTQQAGIRFENISGLVATGLGAESVPFEARQVSDVSCQAMGCYRQFPNARIIIDVGGQFTKIAKITPQGRVADFLMSEKCATGSGRFLQVIARILQVSLEDIGPLSLRSQNPVEFSTNCAVFAESETISRLAEGASPEDILAGVHRAMASKVSMLVKRMKMEQDVVLTGGGGEDEGLALAINAVLQTKVMVPVKPRLMAAFGAACLASID